MQHGRGAAIQFDPVAGRGCEPAENPTWCIRPSAADLIPRPAGHLIAEKSRAGHLIEFSISRSHPPERERVNHEENMIDAVCATLGARCTSNRPAPWWRLFIQLRRGTKNQSVYLGGRNGVDVLGAGIGQHIRQERPSGVNSDILKFRGSAAGFDQDLQTGTRRRNEHTLQGQTNTEKGSGRQIIVGGGGGE